jgi:riboflavin kinase/FMN adenylyltransferase
MQIIPDLQKYKARSPKPIVLALGNFDGFHLGHQKLLRYVVSRAKKEHALAAVLTFPQHPHSILHPEHKPLMLTSLEQKLFYLAEAGIDLCFLQSFTPSFAKITPRDFVEKVLVKKLHIREICMGYDAHFGRGRKGDTSLMEALAGANGFLFKKMRPVMIGGKPVSSSRVRELLMKGRIEKAAQCLGRPFSMFGKVIHGKGHGVHLGFPTANLEVHSEILLPLGVYVASGRFLGSGAIFGKRDRHPRSCFRKKARGSQSLQKWCLTPFLPGVMNFGKRPTYPKDETPRPVLELYLLDFKGQIYGEMMEIELHRFLRPEEKFPTEAILKARIAADVRAARSYYQKK